jgi:hypothetical protein
VCLSFWRGGAPANRGLQFRVRLKKLIIP